ncbi:MAG TPA: Gfo/Idh/MocA family oxidoreductase [Acidimicrobiales bacterium]|nr:Gfo/Idh/MocA family oxidoreductase [Acidimicrobiales bacterium]
MRRLGVGIVGYGVMGRAHAYAWRAAATLRPGAVDAVPVAMSGRDAARLAAVAGPLGLATESDWRALIERDDVDVVDVCAPPGVHAEVALAAAAAGKDVLCEKPLAVTLADAVAMRDAAAGAGLRNAVGFNYRRLPALSLMAELVAAGELGDVRLFRASWLSDEFVDPEVPFDWRFERALGGTTIADLGSHLLDLALWMAGPVTSVSADSATFVALRSTPTGEREVEVDDASSALLRFASGARGTIEVARVAPRRPCDFVVEVNGSRGTAVFDYARLNELWVGSVDDDPRLYGLRRVRAEHPLHPETAGWWPIGQGVGYGASLVNQAADLAAAWESRRWTPDFAHGARVAAVCAAMEASAGSRAWVDVAPV